jgi:2-(1,2-epoxy-1,2-dihydrophenyl)acetyl-CoA isomerase
MSLRSDLADGMLTLTLDRPERLNAIDDALAGALLDAFAAAERSAAVRVIVLCGHGRAFCAGRDVSVPPTPQILERVQAVARAIVLSSRPVVMAVHGWAIGAGVEWMLDADIVVAAHTARFRLPEIGLGVFVTGGISRTLPALVGLARARALLLLGEEFSAEEARRWGMVWSVVEPERLAAETARIARRLAGFDPAAVARFKRVLNRLNLEAFDVALEVESAMQTALAAAPPR